jgi:hypothetical protein
LVLTSPEPLSLDRPLRGAFSASLSSFRRVFFQTKSRRRGAIPCYRKPSDFLTPPRVLSTLARRWCQLAAHQCEHRWPPLFAAAPRSQSARSALFPRPNAFCGRHRGSKQLASHSRPRASLSFRVSAPWRVIADQHVAHNHQLVHSQQGSNLSSSRDRQ